MNLLEKSYDELKNRGCQYCDLRHFMCGHEGKLGEPCDYFVLGRCFRCAYFLMNKGEPVEGICDDTNDFGGCINFKE